MASRRFVVVLLAGALFATGCSGDGDMGGPGGTGGDEAGPAAGPLPTLVGGVDLVAVDPLRVLVGEGLAFGRPLPSEQAAADAFAADPEVSATLARRAHSLPDGRLIAQVLVLALDGPQIFDEGVLAVFVRGVVGALGDGTTTDERFGARTVVRSRGTETVLGFREENLLVVVRSSEDHDARLVVERQLAGVAAGVVGAAEPVTPLILLAAEAAFVPVPTIAFQPIPPPEEEEPPPEAPLLPGVTGVQGRYGVVAGERRTIVWAYAVDPAVYPSAEALEPAMAALASGRSGGAPVEIVEVVDRVVQRATGVASAPSARVFRHQGLVLLVEGADPAQVDAVVSAWITALA